MLSTDNTYYNKKPRSGSIDLWNATLLESALYTEGNDIPICLKCNGTIPAETGQKRSKLPY